MIKLVSVAIFLLACGGKEPSPPSAPTTANIDAVDGGKLDTTNEGTAEPTNEPVKDPDRAPPKQDPPLLDVRIRPKAIHLKDGERVLAGLRPRFRRCAQQASAASGTLTITFSVDTTGVVSNYSASGSKDLPPEARDCMVRALRAATFDPPTTKAVNTFEIAINPP